MERKDHTGFTLTELLVVLAVIAALTGLLFPGIARTRESAREAVCLCNLRQIALASELYAQDYDDTFLWDPAGEGTPGQLSTEQVAQRTGRERVCADRPCTPWTVRLEPYLRSWSVLHCPSFNGRITFMGWSNPGGPAGSGYGLNGLLLGDECEPRTVASLRHSASQVAIFGDSAAPRSGLWLERVPAVAWPRGWGNVISLQGPDEWPRELPLSIDVYWGWQLNPDRAPGWSPELHDGGSNFAYADGHAQFLRPSAQVITVTPHPLPGATTLGPPQSVEAGSFPGALLE